MTPPRSGSTSRERVLGSIPWRTLSASRNACHMDSAGDRKGFEVPLAVREVGDTPDQSR